MVILTMGNKVTICAKEGDIRKGIKHYYVSTGDRLYDTENEFSPVSENGTYLSGGRRLYSEVAIEDYKSHLKQADEEYENLKMKANAASKSGEMQTMLNDMLVQVLAKQSAEAIFDVVMPKVRDKIINEFGILPQVHEVRINEKTNQVKGVVHDKFDKVLNCVVNGIPVFLSGPAGAGKNVICKQVAEGLGLEFYFTNAVTQEYKLTGFIDANGTYHETQFYKAFKDGGLFFLDEMDASIPEVLIILNAAIANGYFDFPTGKVEANENFRVIAAGNTFGTGADIEYSGRYQLDAASLDRFALIEIGYSRKIEEAITENDYELCDFIKAFRKAAEDSGIRHLATYRSMERIHKMSNMMDLNEVLRMMLLKNLRGDDLNVIKKAIQVDGTNKYYKAMCLC